MIAFDLDDTIVNTYDYMKIELKNRLGYEIKSPIERIVIPGVSEEEIKQEIRDALTHLTKNHLEPEIEVKTAIKTIRKLTSQPVPIVTARYPGLQEVTQKWCNKQFGDDVALVLKDNHEKFEYLMKNNIKFWTDDRIDVALQCSEGMEKVFLINHPEWNTHDNLPKNVVRIEFISEVIFQIF